MSKIKPVIQAITMLCLLFMATQTAYAQACVCTEYLYLNEPFVNPATSRVHKYAVAADGTLTEVANPWLTTTELPEAHGLGFDLNGYLYIAEQYLPSDIRRVTCDGEVVSEAEFAIPIRGASNITSIGNTLIVQETSVLGLSLYDVCSQSLVGTICFDGPQLASDWSLYLDENENIYVASGGGDDAIYRFTLAEAEAAAPNCITPLVQGSPGSPLFNPAATNSNVFEVLGITADDDGNIYVIGGTNYGTNGIMYKFDANGVAMGNTGILPNSPVGVIWVESCDCIYVSGSTITNDCIAIYNTDLSYRGTGVGPGTSTLQFGKAIAKTIECCPASANQSISITECNASATEPIFINEVFPCGGVICEAQWEPADPASIAVYDDCNQSIVAGAAAGCYTFTRSSDGTAPNSQCGAFEQTLEINIGAVDAPVMGNNQVLCDGDLPQAFTVETAATGSSTIMYQWYRSELGDDVGFSEEVGATSLGYVPDISTLVVGDTTWFRVEAFVEGCTTGRCADTSNTVLYVTRRAVNFELTTTPATCAGSTANDGIITLTSATDATHYGISSANAASYDGPMTIAAAMVIPVALPADILSNAPNAGATYIVRVFNREECFVDEVVMVAAAPLPTVSAASNNPVCVGDDIELTATFSAAGTSTTAASWSWVGPNGFTSTMEDPTITGATVAAGGNYTVTVTDNNGCMASAMVVVVVDERPVAEAGMPQILCSTAQLSFLTLGASITPALLGGMWTTSGDGQFLGGLGNPLSGDPFYRFGEVASYIPGPTDVMRGEVTLTLTTFNPDGPCDAVNDEVLITILKTDCGSFPWGGEE